MRLYLVQHAEAISEEIDPNRPLTQKGRIEVHKVAKFLKDAGIKIDTIWHSTKLRAKQTAQILAEAICPKGGVVERGGLSPNDSVDKFKEELQKKEGDLMVVGHLPFLGKLASLLLVGSESCNLVSFRQGGLVCLECDEQAKWRLVWAVVPELIEGR